MCESSSAPETFHDAWPYWLYFCNLDVDVLRAKVSRLPDYYNADMLASSRVIVVERVPVPPLSAMGLARFAEFERMDAGGVTYLDTYFVRADHADVEFLHFHELIHVIQWQLLDPERFLALYADGLERFGYRHSPLEVMAYDLQERFERREPPFEVEAACRKRMRELTGLGGNPTILDGQ